MATRLIIEGGSALRGEVQVSAAKNAALPAMAASLLTAKPVILENVPALADVATMRKLLERLGAVASAEPGGVTRLQVARVTSHEAPYDLVSTMRELAAEQQMPLLHAASPRRRSLQRFTDFLAPIVVSQAEPRRNGCRTRTLRISMSAPQEVGSSSVDGKAPSESLSFSFSKNRKASPHPTDPGPRSPPMG